MHALVAEDDFLCRRILVRLLALHGACDGAASGDEAIAAIHAAAASGRPYDLVCLDIEMPGRDGRDVLAELRRLEAERRTPIPARVLMTTAHSRAEHVVTAVQAGCDGFLAKPVDPGRVLAHLVSWGLLDALEPRTPTVESLQRAAREAPSTEEVARRASSERRQVAIRPLASG
jgi:two-component system chemotaxis response regulator CheY